MTMATGAGLTHFTSIDKLATPKTLYLCKNLVISHIQAELNTDFLLKFSNFGYCGNKGGSIKNLNDSIWLADTQNPQFGAEFWELL